MNADYRGAGLLQAFLGDARLVVAEDSADVLDLVGDLGQDIAKTGVAALGARPPAALEDLVGVLVGCSWSLISDTLACNGGTGGLAQALLAKTASHKGCGGYWKKVGAEERERGNFSYLRTKSLPPDLRPASSWAVLVASGQRSVPTEVFWPASSVLPALCR